MYQAGHHQCYLPRGKDSARNLCDTDGMVRSLTLGTDTTSWGFCETVEERPILPLNFSFLTVNQGSEWILLCRGPC